jgi:hypothetical protein
VTTDHPPPITLKTVGRLIKMLDRQLSNLNENIITKLEEDPDVIDTSWFDNRVDQRSALEADLEELHAYRKWAVATKFHGVVRSNAQSDL